MSSDTITPGARMHQTGYRIVLGHGAEDKPWTFLELAEMTAALLRIRLEDVGLTATVVETYDTGEDAK